MSASCYFNIFTRAHIVFILLKGSILHANWEGVNSKKKSSQSSRLRNYSVYTVYAVINPFLISMLCVLVIVDSGKYLYTELLARFMQYAWFTLNVLVPVRYLEMNDRLTTLLSYRTRPKIVKCASQYNAVVCKLKVKVQKHTSIPVRACRFFMNYTVVWSSTYRILVYQLLRS